MISITVTSYNGTPLAQRLSAQFDELGGNIGRAETNQLILPDPERTISRVHAQIVFRGSRFAVVDRGSNPISVNGRPLGNGQEAPLNDGDELLIGGYAMRVAAGAAAGGPVADPFADFGGLAAASPAPSARRAAPAGSGFDDPLGGFGAPSRPPAPPAGGGYGAPPATARGIPEDWDPFAPAPSARPQGDDFARSLGQAPGGDDHFGLEVGGRGAGPLVPGLPGGGGDSLDNLFGLGSSPATGDPLANSVLGQSAALPNMAAHADPMRSLNSMAKGSGQAVADNRSELNSPFMLPPMGARPAAAARPAAPPAAPVRAATPPPSAGSPRPVAGSVLSWGDNSGDTHTVIRSRSAGGPGGAQPAPAAPSAPRGAAPAPALPADFDDLFDAPLVPVAKPAAPAAPVDALFDDLDLAPVVPAAANPMPAPAPVHAPVVPAPQPVAAPPRAAPTPPTPPAMRPVAPQASGSGADQAELIAALREGLRTPGLPIDSLTPELMKLLGQIVHEATRGTVDLLVARAALKREIRAEVTMIVAKGNNPLKFSPSAEVALTHLLSPPARGFMPADRAMRDAYDDLRAHQFGFLAGLRAALEGILKRFDPATLETKLTQKKSMLSTLLPAGRKAKMWDVYQELYSQISTEAEDDFHALFGKEFLRAYEAYIERLDKERPQ